MTEKTCAWCHRTGIYGYATSRGHVVCSARKACLRRWNNTTPRTRKKETR